MSSFETGDSSGTVSLAGLFEDKFEQFPVSVDLRDIAHLVCRGGWPGLLTLKPDAAALVPTQYLDTFVSSTSERAGLDEHRIRRLMASLARNLGQALTYDTIVSDMIEGNVGNKRELLTRQRVEVILSHLKSRFLIEDLGGWDAPIRSKSRVRVKPRRSFVDPSLPAALLGVNESRLLEDLQLFGKLFEELCLRDLRILVSTMDAATPDSLKYYSDSDNLEVDAIIELRDGRWAALEIKLSESKVQDAVDNLLRLKAKIAANPKAQNKEPSFMAVLLGKTKFCRKTPEGVFVIPLTSLGA
jgi:predicted AAA+ superfamily ATPase